MITTTLNLIRSHHPCEDGWKTLLASLDKTTSDDEPLPITHIIDSNGIDDALWCLRTLPEYDREWRLFAIWCARSVDHLRTDDRSHSAIYVSERYANGKATLKELAAARAGARAAAWVAAGDAARNAARDAAGDAARDAARDAAWAAARAAQVIELRRICEGL